MIDNVYNDIDAKVLINILCTNMTASKKHTNISLNYFKRVLASGAYRIGRAAYLLTLGFT